MPHDLINPPDLGAPVGFSHGVLAAPGRILYLAGQNGTVGGNGTRPNDDLAEQFDRCLANLLTVLSSAGGEPAHVTKLVIYVTDVSAYRAGRNALGAIWRRHFGRYYPAMTLVGVTELYEPAALVEIDGVAVIPPITPAAP